MVGVRSSIWIAALAGVGLMMWVLSHGMLDPMYASYPSVVYLRRLETSPEGRVSIACVDYARTTGDLVELASRDEV